MFHFQNRFATVYLFQMSISFFLGNNKLLLKISIFFPGAIEELFYDWKSLQAVIHRWTASEETFGVRIFRIVEDFLSLTVFDDVAVVHHSDVIGDFGDDTEVVRDEDHR